MPQMALIANGLETSADERAWQGDAEGGALSGFAINSDAAGVFLNDSVRDREAESGSLTYAFGGVERIVNLGHVLGSDADAGVGNLGDERSVFRCAGGDDD